MSEYSLPGTNVRSLAIIEPDFIIVLASLSGPPTMPKRSVEDRLQSLQDKRDALAAEIKDIQTQKARQLRKRQHQREALLGKAVYQLVAEGAVITAGTWSEEFLLQLMDRQLVRQRDRQLFGLKPSAASVPPAININTGRAAVESHNSPMTNSSVHRTTPAAISKSKEAPAKQLTASSKRQLVEGSSQDDLMGEFNL
ncbi:MAG: hypothetical protein WBA51_10235 [Erythrobacter sp.]